MTPERIAEIKSIVDPDTKHYINGEPLQPSLSAETARELLAEIERLQGHCGELVGDVAYLEQVKVGLEGVFQERIRLLQGRVERLTEALRTAWDALGDAHDCLSELGVDDTIDVVYMTGNHSHEGIMGRLDAAYKEVMAALGDTSILEAT